jgi:hypothetical protein
MVLSMSLLDPLESLTNLLFEAQFVMKIAADFHLSGCAFIMASIKKAPARGFWRA